MKVRITDNSQKLEVCMWREIFEKKYFKNF